MNYNENGILLDIRGSILSKLIEINLFVECVFLEKT